jgi:hypothetical protein
MTRALVHHLKKLHLTLAIFFCSFIHSIAAVLVSGMTIASMSSSRKSKVSKDALS